MAIFAHRKLEKMKVENDLVKTLILNKLNTFLEYFDPHRSVVHWLHTLREAPQTITIMHLISLLILLRLQILIF